MSNRKAILEGERELQKAILEEKTRGTPDLEIGQKYGVTFRYIERLITKSYGVSVSAFKAPQKIKTLHPRDFKEAQTTVWSFKRRGDWATHSGEYRGNWSPYIPRNVILRYSRPGELVLDYFCGAGTTAVEAKLLGRRCIAFDINAKAIELAKENISFNTELPQLELTAEGTPHQIYEPEISVGDARDLSFLPNNSIDLICAHPPYANIIHYTDSNESDLSFLDMDEFLKEMSKVARESFRVLKPERQCAILIGDMRRKKHVIPLGFELITVYLDAGFKLRELVIKRQHNCKTTGFWYTSSVKHNFLLLAHEYLPVFEKPKATPLSAREGRVDYDLFGPVLKTLRTGKKLDQLEATTVWVLPEKEYDKRLNKNVLERYSNGTGYSIVTLTSHLDSQTRPAKEKKLGINGLLFIKSPSLSERDDYSTSHVEHYLKTIDETINRDLPNIDAGGFLVIQTQDVRINGYIEPLAKRLVDMLTSNNLWLKEIVAITQEGSNSNVQHSGDYLTIAHQYLLVYEVKR